MIFLKFYVWVTWQWLPVEREGARMRAWPSRVRFSQPLGSVKEKIGDVRAESASHKNTAITIKTYATIHCK